MGLYPIRQLQPTAHATYQRGWRRYLFLPVTRVLPIQNRKHIAVDRLAVGMEHIIR